MKIPDVSKIDVLGAQDEVIYVDFSLAKLASLGIEPSTLVAALQAQNIVRPSGVLRTGEEAISLQVSGAFTSEQDVLNVNFAAGDRILRLRDVAEVRRGYTDPPQPMFRVNGKPAIGLAIAMRDGGDILALGRSIKAAMSRITANLPIGIQPTLVADQAEIVDHAISDFTSSLWQAIVIVLAVSFVALGVRAGSVVAIAIPLTLAIVFPVMSMVGIDLQRISLGALIIALTLLVDDAHDDNRRDDAAACRRRRDAGRGGLRLSGARLCDAVGHPGDDRRLCADRLRPELGRGIYLFDLRGRRDRADRVVVCRRVLRPAAGHDAAAPAKAGATRQSRAACSVPIALSRAGDPGQMGDVCRQPRAPCPLRSPGSAWCRGSFFRPRTASSCLSTSTSRRTLRSTPPRATVERLEQHLTGDPDIDHFSSYVGRGAPRFYLPLNVQLGEPVLRPGGDRHQQHRGARRLPVAARNSAGRTIFRTSSGASIRSNSGRPLVGHCNIACWARIWTKCATPRCRWRR